jgi:hypothetical protein
LEVLEGRLIEGGDVFATCGNDEGFAPKAAGLVVGDVFESLMTFIEFDIVGSMIGAKIVGDFERALSTPADGKRAINIELFCTTGAKLLGETVGGTVDCRFAINVLIIFPVTEVVFSELGPLIVGRGTTTGTPDWTTGAMLVGELVDSGETRTLAEGVEELAACEEFEPTVSSLMVVDIAEKLAIIKDIGDTVIELLLYVPKLAPFNAGANDVDIPEVE